LYNIEYFRRLNGRVPAQEWLDKQEYSISAGFLAKFRMAEAEGLNLLKTKALEKIIGQPNLYEIKYRSYRIITYFDKSIDTFLMLNGFKKQKMNEKMEIERGIKLMNEYLAIYGGNK
jgi:hypothetical protein